jgi:hypothetical protein
VLISTRSRIGFSNDHGKQEDWRLRYSAGLKALMHDQRVREAMAISQDAAVRKLSGGITVYPWQEFCIKLWAGGFRCLE